MEEGYYNLIAFTGSLCTIQRCQYAGRQVHCHLVISEALYGEHRQALFISQRSQNSASCIECGEIESRQIFVRSHFAVSGNITEYQCRILCVESFPIQAGSLQRSLTPVADKYIRIGDQLLQSFSSFFGFRVQGNTSLAGILQVVGCVFLLIQRTTFVYSGVSQRVSLRSFHFDNVCTQVSEESCGTRSGNKCCQLYNLHPFQGESYFAHFITSCFSKLHIHHISECLEIGSNLFKLLHLTVYFD